MSLRGRGIRLHSDQEFLEAVFASNASRYIAEPILKHEEKNI